MRMTLGLGKGKAARTLQPMASWALLTSRVLPAHPLSSL